VSEAGALEVEELAQPWSATVNRSRTAAYFTVLLLGVTIAASSSSQGRKAWF
jgi:hypothetical protein